MKCKRISLLRFSLTGREAEIHALLEKRISKSAIARILGVHRITVANFIKEIREKATPHAF